MYKKINPNCAICDVVLTDENQKIVTPYDFQSVCKEHEQYGYTFQPEVVKKKLGLITEFSDKFNKCCICQAELTPEEKDTVSEIDFNITCNKHREVKGVFQINMAKLWIEFKKDNPDATLDRPEWLKKFDAFRSAHIKKQSEQN